MLWLLIRFLRSLKRESEQQPSSKPIVIPRSRFADRIRELRKRYRRSKDFRAGCHELAEILRQHFEAKRKHRFSVRFMSNDSPDIRPDQVTRDIEFKLQMCTI